MKPTATEKQPPKPETAGSTAAPRSATGLPELHRLSVRHDGIEIIGATLVFKRPEKSEQIAELLRELLRMLEAPDVPDPEVLACKTEAERDKLIGGMARTQYFRDCAWVDYLNGGRAEPPVMPNGAIIKN